MEVRTLHHLEFPKVLRLLAGYAVSEPGHAACLALAPFDSPDEARFQAELYSQAKAWGQETGFQLGEFPSLEGIFGFLERPQAVLDVDGLWAMKQALIQTRAARELLQVGADPLPERWPDLCSRVAAAAWPAKTWSGLKRCLADDGHLKDESSPELLAARSRIRTIHQQCSKRAKEFILERNLSAFLQDDYITISSDRYVLPLRANFKGRFPGIIHDYSQTGETCYFEPLFLVELNNTLQELKQEEREAERKVLLFLTSLVREEFEAIHAAYRTLVELDLLQAKLGLAAALGATCLELTPDGPLKLYAARHPLLAYATRASGTPEKKGKQGEAKINGPIPIDLELADGQRGIIISGGNAGGKTVCLKMLGLIATMALAGLPVPVGEGSTLPAWRKIFVFMGDEQSIEDHVSTFTAQIGNLSRIWPEVDAGTLVILDEFGAGTDPTQGAALAQAVVDGLIERQACVAAATHFPALKVYALSRPDIRAASVLFDPRTKRPLYRLAYDQVGLSQALDVAREHGLPEEVLRRAENYMLLDGADTSALIERLNELAHAREQELESLTAERAKLAVRREKLETRYEKDKKALLDEVGGLSREIFRQWQTGRTAHKQAMRELQKAKERVVDVARDEAEPTVAFDALYKGASVLYVPWNKKGLVEEIDAKRQQIKLDLQGVSMWAKLEDLQLESGQAMAPAGPLVSVRVERIPALRLDLRGYRADVALSELATFLDKALLGNANEVEILHGRGTGALRREVHRFLTDFPAVRSFALASEEYGGDGMTIVALQ